MMMKTFSMTEKRFLKKNNTNECNSDKHAESKMRHSFSTKIRKKNPTYQLQSK